MVFSMLKSPGIGHQGLLDAYVLVWKIKRSKGDEKCAQPALMLVTWGPGSACTNRPSLSWQTWRTPEKLYKWCGDRVERDESRKPTEPATGEMIFPGPPFPPKSPPNLGSFISWVKQNCHFLWQWRKKLPFWKGNFFLHCHKKWQFCFTQEINDNLNFAPKVFQSTKTNRW